MPFVESKLRRAFSVLSRILANQAFAFADTSMAYLCPHINNLSSEAMSKTGTVKFFNDAKGFGFIVQDDGGEDLFAHRNQIADGQDLLEGDTVRYDVGWDDRKGKSNAENITGGSGGEGGKGGFGGGKGGFGGSKGGGK